MLRLTEEKHGWSKKGSGRADLILVGRCTISERFSHIHQKALCGIDLDISYVLILGVFAVNFILGYTLNYCQFQAFLEENRSDYSELPCNTAVRWLSGSNVLCCSHKLRNEIGIFLTEKDGADTKLSDHTWLSKLSFSFHIISHMNALNLKFQRKDNLVCDLCGMTKKAIVI